MSVLPGYDRSMPSTMVSPWHRVFVDMGYPELDVITYPDGEWGIRQYHQTPLVPSMTRWSFVLQGVRNREITEGVLKDYAHQLDLEKRTVWEEQAKHEKRLFEESLARERRSEVWATEMMKGINRDPYLKERILKNGLKELDPRRMLQHVPRYKLSKDLRELR